MQSLQAMDQPRAPTMGYEFLPTALCMALYLQEAATDAEWDVYLEFLRGHLQHGEQLKFLVYNHTGAMQRAHQTRLQAVVGHSQHRVALLSPAIGFRFIASMFMLTNRRLKVFAPAQIDDAYAHLELTGSVRKSVEQSMQRLRARLEAPAGLSKSE